ncbi:MAG: hypothetical protein ACR2G5_15690 [Pyrinomonadaceae bacterium]
MISETPFTFKNLRPTGSKLFAEDENFRQVHNRFNSESVFLYFDVASVEKENQERIRRMEEDERKLQEIEAANPRKAEPEDASPVSQMRPNEPQEEPPSPAPVIVGPPQATLGVSPEESPADQTSAAAGEGGSDQFMPSLNFPSLLLSGASFGGAAKWPEAIGVAIVFDGDSYFIRSLLMNGPDGRGNAVPFIPQLVSGPALIPESPSILPADTELLVVASLDYPQIYEGMVKAMTGAKRSLARPNETNNQR